MGSLGQLVPLEPASKGEKWFEESGAQKYMAEHRRVNLGLGDNKQASPTTMGDQLVLSELICALQGQFGECLDRGTLGTGDAMVSGQFKALS